MLKVNVFFPQFVSLGEQQNFGIKTAGLEDKATACQMLVCYARELKEHFVEYTEQTVRILKIFHKKNLNNLLSKIYQNFYSFDFLGQINGTHA